MSKYEFTFLLNEENEAKKLKELFATYSAKITKEDKWGNRELAYPINKITSAHYFLWEVEIDPKSVTDLKKKLNFNEKILRYLLLKID